MISIGSLKVMAPYMTIFKATFEGQTLEMMIYLHDGKTVLLQYLARQVDNLASDILQGCGSYLQWESIRYFKKLGYQVLDLGGLVLDRQSPLLHD